MATFTIYNVKALKKFWEKFWRFRNEVKQRKIKTNHQGGA